MEINYIRELSFVNFPGYSSSVVFTQGCNFCCPYCYNTECIPKGKGTISFSDALVKLKNLKGKVDHVVVTGGEPTIHEYKLIGFIKALKEVGFKVKLDTNGSNPNILATLLIEKLVDYVAMDVKAPFTNLFKKTTGMEIKLYKNEIEASIRWLKCSSIDYEFRTVMTKNHKPSDIDKIIVMLGEDRKAYNVHKCL